MQPYNLSQLLGPLQKRSPSLALYLPRTSDLRQLAEQIETDDKITVIHYCMEGASKVRTFASVPVITASLRSDAKYGVGYLCIRRRLWVHSMVTVDLELPDRAR